MAAFMLLIVLVGFSKSFFFRPLFSEMKNVSTELFFYGHGLVFTFWFILLLIQPYLIQSENFKWHKRLGGLGAIIALFMLGTGILAGFITAARSESFQGTEAGPIEFLMIPISGVCIFFILIAFAFSFRKKGQYHKRLMLLGSIVLLDAPLRRLPFDQLIFSWPATYFTGDMIVLFMVFPIIAWDIFSIGRLHHATIFGGFAILIFNPLRALLVQTETWISFAEWGMEMVTSNPIQL
jgi:uncharacterized membrane protein YozB (DUF420 family)